MNHARSHQTQTHRPPQDYSHLSSDWPQVVGLESWDRRGSQHLQGVPQLSEELAELARCRSLTPDQEELLSREIAKICTAIREAQHRWDNKNHSPDRGENETIHAPARLAG